MTNLPAGPASATITLNDRLELRAEVVVHEGDGHPIGVDVRLYRRVPSDLAAGMFSPTGAGFRLPVDRVEELCGQLLALAKASAAER